MFGTISANAAYATRLKDTLQRPRPCAGPDDVYLALRGLRTMAVRLARHNESGMKVARWLAARPEVARVLHPGLESDPGHAIWKRDFTGASGLFSIVLKPASEKAVYAFMDELTLFGMGYSWGGFESLVISFDCSGIPHRDAMGARRADLALSHRPGRHRRSDRRSRTRLRGDDESRLATPAAAVPPLRMTNCRLRR